MARMRVTALLGSAALCLTFHGGAAHAAATDPQVARGKYLVDMGDCAACHTAAGGAALAGNYALNSPVGVMYTPNLTPDKDTGIGSWTDDQFYRAFHEGRDDQGKNLYPAFPYQWFTRVTRDDVVAIKAYLMTLPPVHSPQRANTISFPFSIRSGLAVWNAVYFKPGTFQPDPAKSPEINRGAYIAEGLGHCSDCHTPKNFAMAPVTARQYAGGVLDHWYAPNISSGPQGIGGWSDEALFHYLKTGVDAKRGVVLGPMAETIRYSLSRLTDSDLHDVVDYLKATKPMESYQPRTPVLATDQRPGAAIYASYCAECHKENGQGEVGKIPALAGNGAVTAKGPENVIRVVVGGVRAQASYGPMPGFGTVMSSQQIADVTNFVRSGWSNQAPAAATANDVGAVAKDTHNLLAGTQTCPPLGSSPLESALTDPAGGAAAVLQATREENVLQSANKVAAILRGKVPGAQQADIVNAATDAYCPVLAADTSLDPVRRWQLLNQFGETLYTQIGTRGRD